MTTSMYRQGDLLFTEIPVLPEGLMARETNVIVEGEVTGHSHRLLEGSVLEDTWGALFLDLPSATQVIHQEHHALCLPPGRYRVIRQREYTPDDLREVLD